MNKYGIYYFFATFASDISFVPDIQDKLEYKEALCLSLANENLRNFQACTRVA